MSTALKNWGKKEGFNKFDFNFIWSEIFCKKLKKIIYIYTLTVNSWKNKKEQ